MNGKQIDCSIEQRKTKEHPIWYPMNCLMHILTCCQQISALPYWIATITSCEQSKCSKRMYAFSFERSVNWDWKQRANNKKKSNHQFLLKWHKKNSIDCSNGLNRRTIESNYRMVNWSLKWHKRNVANVWVTLKQSSKVQLFNQMPCTEKSNAWYKWHEQEVKCPNDKQKK